MRILLDANLGTLLVLGSADHRLIGVHRRIRSYTKRDFDDLTAELAKTDAIVFLPNTLTEISNLIGFRTAGALSKTVFDRFRVIIEGSDEQYVSSLSASRRDEFTRLGLTDAALLEAGGAGWMLLTDDDDLYVAALRAGHKARNFRHIRAER